MSPRVQVELLRVLEEKVITRVGSNSPLPVDFRVVAATNRNLRNRVDLGAFREDLYWRLNVFTIEMPPLRERLEDISILAEHFLARFGSAMGRPPLRFSPAALAAMTEHAWPGNVRELQNAVERAVVVTARSGSEAGASELIDVRDLPLAVTATSPAASPLSLREVERAHVAAILERTGWNISQAARFLDVDRVTLYNKIRKYGLKRPGDGSSAES